MTATRIAGWDVVEDPAGLSSRYAAYRVGPLDDYARSHGALSEVTALTVEELRILCSAQSQLSYQLAAAERLRRLTQVSRAAAASSAGSAPPS